MILACPSCATRFRVEDDALGVQGRRVRCSVCAREWRVPGAEVAEAPKCPEPAPAPVAPAQPAPVKPLPVLEPFSSRTAERPRPAAVMPQIVASEPQSRRGLALLAVLLVLGGAGFVAWMARAEILSAVPWLQPYYDRLGLDRPELPLAAALALEQVASTRTAQDGHDVVVVEGIVRNVAAARRDLPAILVTMKDDAGRPLKVHTMRLPQRAVEAASESRFEIRLLDPPLEAVRFEVSFLAPVERSPGR